MKQNYGVLRVVRVRDWRPLTNTTTNLQDRYPSGWLPDEQLVHLLTQDETTIGRALHNDIILMDPTVSREHARLMLDAYGWHVINLTLENIVRVNGRPVPSGGSLPMQPQDILILGSTMLQLIAPLDAQLGNSSSNFDEFPTKKLPVQAPQLPSFDKAPAPWERQSSPDGQGAAKLPPLAAPAQPSASMPREVPSYKHSLPVQSEPELVAAPWEDEEEDVLGAGVTMQFALPQRMGIRTRWLIAGIGLAILIVSATITIILNSFIGLTALAQYGAPNLLAAIIIPVVPALGINLLVNFMDRFEREPWFLRLAAFLWGAIIAIPPALFIERKVYAVLQNLGPNTSDVVRSALQGLNAGVTEETIKGLGLLLLFLILRDEFDNVTDGIVYGALIGAGFAMVENFRYFALDFRQFPVFLIIYRIVLGWLGHSTFTVCFGAALGYIRHTKVPWRQIVIPLLGYLVAVGLHSFFDFVDFQASAALTTFPGNSSVAFLSLLALIGDYIPPFLAQMLLLYVLIKSLAHEAAVIREFLAAEVSNGVVKVDEYALLQNSFQRTRAERRVFRRSGFRQWLRVKALYQTEIGLAFRKWHVSMGDKPKLGYRQPEDAYRRRIKRLRQEMTMAGLRGYKS